MLDLPLQQVDLLGDVPGVDALGSPPADQKLDLGHVVFKIGESILVLERRRGIGFLALIHRREVHIFWRVDLVGPGPARLAATVELASELGDPVVAVPQGIVKLLMGAAKDDVGDGHLFQILQVSVFTAKAAEPVAGRELSRLLFFLEGNHAGK